MKPMITTEREMDVVHIGQGNCGAFIPWQRHTLPTPPHLQPPPTLLGYSYLFSTTFRHRFSARRCWTTHSCPQPTVEVDRRVVCWFSGSQERCTPSIYGRLEIPHRWQIIACAICSKYCPLTLLSNALIDCICGCGSGWTAPMNRRILYPDSMAIIVSISTIATCCEAPWKLLRQLFHIVSIPDIRCVATCAYQGRLLRR